MDQKLASSLLMTKLHVPRLRRGLISRPRLTAQLDDGFTQPLTLIAAPAGFGKTTLVADWLGQRNLPAAWVSLDAGDDDPARFWSYVIAALEILQPGVGERALALLNSPETHSAQAILTALINAVAASPAEFGLILDDYHVIDNPQIHAALAFLITHAPPQMHVILSTRADPPLPMASWRARGQQIEIRAADLRFTSDETTHFLNATMGLNLSPGEIAALDNRTEGWIAGLQLAAMALREQESTGVAGFISEATSSNHFVVDYFLNEVLQAQEPSVRDFLRRTSLLERLSAPLCDAVTARKDSAAILNLLEHAGLFVVSMDAEHHWYRYHHLFADVLRKMLEQTEPDQVPELHCRASCWFAENRLIPEAIAHALAARDDSRAAGLIEQAGMETLGRGEVTTLLNWLEALPVEQIHARPRLCLYYASALMAAGRFDAVPPLLQAAELGLSSDQSGSETGALVSLLAMIQATFAARYGDESLIIDLTRHALDCQPEDPTGMTGIRSWLRGLAYVSASQTVAANRKLSEAINMSQAAGESCMVALETYAYGLVESTRGRLTKAGAAYRRALASLAERGEDDAPVAGLVYLGLGELLRMRNDLVTAESSILKGLRLARQWSNGAALVQGYVSFAWLSQAQGDPNGALVTLNEAEGLVQGRAGARSLVLLNAQRARLQLAQNRHDEAEHWALEYASRMDDHRGNDASDIISQTEFLTWAQLRIIQGRPDETLAGLQRLHAAAESAGWLRLRIDSAALLALAWKAAGEVQKALTSLEEALSLAEPEGYVALFTDLGAPMGWLLAEATRRTFHRQPRLQSYAARLLAAFGMQDDARQPVEHLPSGPEREMIEGLGATSARPAAAFVAPLVEPLSVREREVLQLVAAGLSNQEIADRLFIGLATVKTHTHNIYEKLGVRDRRQAILRANELGLL
jgi:LuxR family maltose regulon positive regulatory protein